MQLPINVRWDKSVKARIVVTRMDISDKDIDDEVVSPHPVELVNCILEIPYPMAQRVMEAVSRLVCSNPKGIKLYDSM
jgi:hypothetical protein